MSGYPYGSGPRRERKRLGRVALLIALALVALVVVFTLGVALGEALHEDGPKHGVTQTSVRTLEPLPQQPSTTAGP